jgi:hypothetical protein
LRRMVVIVPVEVARRASAMVLSRVMAAPEWEGGHALWPRRLAHKARSGPV